MSNFRNSGDFFEVLRVFGRVEGLGLCFPIEESELVIKTAIKDMSVRSIFVGHIEELNNEKYGFNNFEELNNEIEH